MIFSTVLFFGLCPTFEDIDGPSWSIWKEDTHLLAHKIMVNQVFHNLPVAVFADITFPCASPLVKLFVNFLLYSLLILLYKAFLLLVVFCIFALFLSYGTSILIIAFLFSAFQWRSFLLTSRADPEYNSLFLLSTAFSVFNTCRSPTAFLLVVLWIFHPFLLSH